MQAVFSCAKERDYIGKYPIIYADPPWRYSAKKVQGAAENHYPTMSIEELCALPVADLAAPDSALFLWAGLLDEGERRNLPAGDQETPQAAGRRHSPVYHFAHRSPQQKAG